MYTTEELARGRGGEAAASLGPGWDVEVIRVGDGWRYAVCRWSDRRKVLQFKVSCPGPFGTVTAWHRPTMTEASGPDARAALENLAAKLGREKGPGPKAAGRRLAVLLRAAAGEEG
jgi:hypothetical protein